jgi:hypothetical protein
LPIFQNFSNITASQAENLRIVPYNGNRAYKYYLDGYKVNGKRKRLFFKDVAAGNRKLAELVKRQKKEGQNGLDISLELRVMAVKAAQRLAPFNKGGLLPEVLQPRARLNPNSPRK